MVQDNVVRQDGLVAAALVYHLLDKLRRPAVMSATSCVQLLSAEAAVQMVWVVKAMAVIEQLRVPTLSLWKSLQQTRPEVALRL